MLLETNDIPHVSLMHTEKFIQQLWDADTFLGEGDFTLTINFEKDGMNTAINSLELSEEETG